MKKLNLSLFIVFGFFLIGLVFLFPAQETALAKSDNSVINQSNNGNQGKNQNTVTTEDITQTEDATEIQGQGKENKGNEESNKGQINAEIHRSAVANFVQSLLSVADREGGIGEQVKVVAQEQSNSKEVTAEAIDKVKKRSKIKTFLLGTDYKNVGALRSEMVKTRNHIEQLKRLVDKAENEQNRTELQTQIQNLEQEQTNIDNFISQNENKFSLFGWAVKLFVK